MESVFQSRFWISSSCWWMTDCSSAESRSHMASTFERGMAGSADDADAAGDAVCEELAAAANARDAGGGGDEDAPGGGLAWGRRGVGVERGRERAKCVDAGDRGQAPV